MKIRTIFILASLITPHYGLCGDYSLTISDDLNAKCTTEVRKIHEWCESKRAKGNVCMVEKSWPIHTTEEVIQSLKMYFANMEPAIGILFASFSNGHLSFCSNEEKRKIYEALQEIKQRGNVSNKHHLDDFIQILGVKK